MADRASLDLASRYRRLLGERFGPRLVLVALFGSRARGDHSADSDIDVAVIVSELTENERDEAINLALAAWRSGGHGPLLSPLVWSEEEWWDRLASERRIALDVQREGVLV